jgi:hypothetical protein
LRKRIDYSKVGSVSPVEQLEAELARWTRRVKLLEARLDVISQVAGGRHDEASRFLGAFSKPLRPPRESPVLRVPSPPGMPTSADVAPFAAGAAGRGPPGSRRVASPPPYPQGYHSTTQDPVSAYEDRDHETHVEAVEHFSKAMVEKLDKNAHKIHWSNLEYEHLLNRLDEEFRELREAVAWSLQVTLEGPTEEADARVRDEAVDVANFAMMLFDSHRGPL